MQVPKFFETLFILALLFTFFSLIILGFFSSEYIFDLPNNAKAG